MQFPQNYSSIHYYSYVGAKEEISKCSSNEILKRDHCLNTCLHWAVRSGKTDVVVFMLPFLGAIVNAQNNNGETALLLAVSLGLPEIVLQLLMHGANPNLANIDGVSPLHFATANADLNSLQILLKSGAFINAVDEEAENALFYAIRENNGRSHFDTIGFLLQHGCDLRLKNEDGETCVELARDLQETEVLQLLTLQEPKKKILIIIILDNNHNLKPNNLKPKNLTPEWHYLDQLML